MNQPHPTVLIVDDDDTFRTIIARELEAAGFKVAARSNGEGVEAALTQFPSDVVLLDLKMTGMDGLETLRHVKAVRPLTEVVFLTGHGSLESAIQAVKLGAFDYLTKPCELDHLESVLRRAAASRAMRSENAALRHALNRADRAGAMVSASPAMKRVEALIDKVAPTSSTVLIGGESGTGKEVVARAIHERSGRRDRPFVVLDCGATDENLALSQLFGHERGAYTGASTRKHGLFELADGGTILIDEIGDASMALQTHLLRVLETGTFRPLGCEDPISVDVRVLAATNRDLETRVRAGEFREDLYYRLNVLAIHLPPLRERVEDIPPLVEVFLKRTYPGKALSVTDESMTLLRRYAWPGNVRELGNVVERAVILCDGTTIRPGDLPGNLVDDSQLDPLSGSVPDSLQELERRYLMTLLERYDGHRGRVAAALGVSERTLYRKLRALAL